MSALFSLRPMQLVAYSSAVQVDFLHDLLVQVNLELRTFEPLNLQTLVFTGS